MPRRYRRRRNKDSIAGSFMRRATRSILAVVILAAFVLGIAFGMKQISRFDAKKIAHVFSPYLSKVGLSEEQVGEVAGELIKRATDVGIEGRAYFDEMSSNNVEGNIVEGESSTDTSSANTKFDPIIEIAIMADSHVANDKPEYVENKGYLQMALAQASEKQVDRAIHLGDMTNYGVLSDLREVKSILDASEIDYVTLPGDRDLAASLGTENFNEVFGNSSQTFELEGFKFVLLDNSANYTLIDEQTLSWFNKEVKDADFVILSQPVYTDGLVLFNCQYMGSTCSETEDESLRQKQQAVLSQRGVILDMIRNSSVKAVIAGDHHKSSETTDGNQSHHIVGAVGGSVNEYSQKSLQSQRFSIFSVYEDGSYDLTDVELEIIP